MTYKIELPATDIQYIGLVLDKLPYGEVSRLVASIQSQITRQDNEAKLAAVQASMPKAPKAKRGRKTTSSATAAFVDMSSAQPNGAHKET